MTARSFGYDAAGDITSDSASVGGSGPAVSRPYAEGRLAKAHQTSTPSTAATCAYEAHHSREAFNCALTVAAGICNDFIKGNTLVTPRKNACAFQGEDVSSRWASYLRDDN